MIFNFFCLFTFYFILCPQRLKHGAVSRGDINIQIVGNMRGQYHCGQCEIDMFTVDLIVSGFSVCFVLFLRRSAVMMNFFIGPSASYLLCIVHVGVTWGR